MEPHSQVIFLPGTVRSSRQTHSDIAHSHPDDQIQFSSNEDEISSREDTMRSDLINPAASVPVHSEDPGHHVMSGSYAYVRQDCCFNLSNSIIQTISDLI